MIPDAQLHAQLPHTLGKMDLPALGDLYRGKVRDNYSRGDRIVMITTDRVSAFDHVLGTIPFKGEVLSRLTAFWFEKVKDIAPTHLVEVPDPSVMVVKKAKPLPIEIVIRGYITGSLWRDYEAGKAGAYGIAWPKGLRKDQRLAAPLVTPSTKAEYGKHDEPISEQEILAKKLVAPELWKEATAVAQRLFQRGQEWARTRGLILVDTKYEMGVADGKLVVIDEIHTPDSSRYWVADGYEDRFARGVDQEMLDKENIRQWLIKEHGFSGHGKPPPLTDEVRVMLARKYIEVYERLTGEAFTSAVGSVAERIERNLRAGKYLQAALLLFVTSPACVPTRAAVFSGRTAPELLETKRSPDRFRGPEPSPHDRLTRSPDGPHVDGLGLGGSDGSRCGGEPREARVGGAPSRGAGAGVARARFRDRFIRAAAPSPSRSPSPLGGRGPRQGSW